MERTFFGQPISALSLERHPVSLERATIQKGPVKNVEVSQIIRLEGTGNYTWVYLQNKPRLLVCKTLKCLEEQLPGFLRVHKTHLINPSYISLNATKKYQLKGRFIELANGEILPWSRNKYREYRKTTITQKVNQLA